MESAKTVNEMTLNELVKLTMLWTTGPSYFNDEWIQQGIPFKAKAIIVSFTREHLHVISLCLIRLFVLFMSLFSYAKLVTKSHLEETITLNERLIVNK